MKARDSVKNYDSKIREYVNYSYRQSKNACKNFGSRPAGGENEKELVKHLVSELETCANEVKTESFSFAKTTSFSENIFTIIFLALAVLFVILECFGIFLNDTIPAVATAVSVIAGVANIFTGYTSKIFAKKTESSNIFAVRKADNEATKRLILLANSDSAPKYKFSTFPFGIISTVGFALTIVVMFLNSALDIFTKVPNLKFASLALILFLPLAVIPLFADSNESSQGASKNLSGSFASIAVLKYLKDNSIEMPSLEICVLITSAKEYASAGAKAFANSHPSDFKDIPTVCLNLDSIACEEDNLGIITTKLSEKSVSLIKDGSADTEKELGNSVIQGKYQTDAAIISSMGIDSCALTSLGADYMKKPDTFEDMKVKTIETALKTVVSGAFLYEEQ